MTLTMVRVGEMFRHKKTGGTYIVLEPVATIEATMTTAVVYKSVKDHRVWVRPIDEFMDGRFESLDLSKPESI